mgnify:CR=1 FL=1|jgi:2-haloacid dehalogenase|tara:strand:+ start:3285 stop:3956 length:672 start_codon:yes stop_codon:yes gene_type:complete
MTTSPLAKQAQETGITTVIFDMGAVLIDWDPRYLYRRIFQDESALEDFLAQVCSPQWNLTMDGGRPVDQALAERQRLYPQHHDAIQAWKDRWPEMLAGSVPGSAALVRDLHQAGVPLYGLTNFSAETWPHAQARFAFLSCFEDILVSGQERLVKPAPEIYHRLLTRNGLQAGHCLFIDDSEKNIAAAQAVGLQTHHFTQASGLRRRLVAAGLLPPEVRAETAS